MWKPLYDWFIQFFSGLSWGQFLASNRNNVDAANRVRAMFRNDLYPLSGLILITATVLGLILYYYVYNRKGGAGYGFKLKKWFIFLIVTVIVAFSVTIGIAVYSTKPYGVLSPFKLSLALAFANAVYTAIGFFLLSLLFKRASVANRTPF